MNAARRRPPPGPSSHPCARSVSRTARGEWSARGVTFTRRRVRPAACPEEVREPATRRASSGRWPAAPASRPAAGCAGGSGRFLTSRSRSSRSIVSRSSSASAIRSSSSRFCGEDLSGAGVGLVDQPLDLVVHHLRGPLGDLPALGELAAEEDLLLLVAHGDRADRARSCRTASPYAGRARWPARCRSPRPVVTLSAPKMISSATRPPKNIARLPISQSLL